MQTVSAEVQSEPTSASVRSYQSQSASLNTHPHFANRLSRDRSTFLKSFDTNRDRQLHPVPVGCTLWRAVGVENGNSRSRPRFRQSRGDCSESSSLAGCTPVLCSRVGTIGAGRRVWMLFFPDGGGDSRWVTTTSRQGTGAAVGGAGEPCLRSSRRSFCLCDMFAPTTGYYTPEATIPALCP